MVKITKDGGEIYTIDVPQSFADQAYLHQVLSALQEFDALVSEITDPTGVQLTNSIQGIISLCVDEVKQDQLMELFDVLEIEEREKYREVRGLSPDACLNVKELGKIRWKVIWRVKGEFMDWFAQFLNSSKKQTIIFRKVGASE